MRNLSPAQHRALTFLIAFRWRLAIFKWMGRVRRRAEVRGLLSHILVVAIMAGSLSGALAQPGSGLPLAGFDVSKQGADAEGFIIRVHGFHCRRVLGWNPSLGVYNHHRHEGMCQDYERCWRVQQRCIFVLGKGWGGWKYERFRFDNWRYTSCMMRKGCY